MISSRSINMVAPSARRVAMAATTSSSPNSLSMPMWIGCGLDDENESRRNFTSPAYRRYKKKQQLPGNSKPTLEMAMSMARNVQQMDNVSLITIAAMEDHEARCEVLKRHIMSVDKVSYDEACVTFKDIAKKNREGMLLAALPYYTGVALAVTAAVASVPMVFHLGTAVWFNENYVTTDVPEPRDLETALEVGSWTWNWMEPPLGQISFALLCLQFSRAQLQNLGAKPYTQKLKQMRAQALSKAFPKYDSAIVGAFSETDVISVV